MAIDVDGADDGLDQVGEELGSVQFSKECPRVTLPVDQSMEDFFPKRIITRDT